MGDEQYTICCFSLQVRSGKCIHNEYTTAGSLSCWTLRTTPSQGRIGLRSFYKRVKRPLLHKQHSVTTELKDTWFGMQGRSNGHFKTLIYNKPSLQKQKFVTAAQLEMRRQKIQHGFEEDQTSIPFSGHLSFYTKDLFDRETFVITYLFNVKILTQKYLQLPTKVSWICHVYTTVHETKTVGRRNLPKETEKLVL